jgi:hypothetical protein
MAKCFCCNFCRTLNESTKEKHVDQQEETAKGKRDVDTYLLTLDEAADRVTKVQFFWWYCSLLGPTTGRSRRTKSERDGRREARN